MKKLYFIAFFLLIFCKVNGQINEVEEFDRKAEKLFESLKMPKVVINKNLVAYTTFYAKKTNGIEAESEMNNPNIKNPYYIYIKSNRNEGTIIIQNKNMTEDMIIDFQYIEKSKKQNKITAYFFFTNNKKIEAIYNTVDGGHNMLTITYNYDSNNSETMQYVISKI
ncbi:hypothetical protein [Mariniflexile sp.]|uniref:hypothetical protein n=1 Tax=Mariniflexile sp. TaxID=1979402 RepID=UPI004048D806